MTNSLTASASPTSSAAVSTVLSKPAVIQPVDPDDYLLPLLGLNYLSSSNITNVKSAHPSYPLSIHRSSRCDIWVCRDPSPLHIHFKVCQLFCKQLEAESQVMGAGPDIDLSLGDNSGFRLSHPDRVTFARIVCHKNGNELIVHQKIKRG